MRILITGGAGFIGSHTADLLIEKGFKVRILDNLEPQVHGNKRPDYINQKMEFVFGDIKNLGVWRKGLKDVNAVIHLAAMVGVSQSMYQPNRYLLTNTIGTTNLYEVLLHNPEIRKNIEKIIVASSKSIYGEGAYKCKNHGTMYPSPRPVEQLKKGDWELHCPFCQEYLEPVAITEEKPVQNLSIYALSKYDTEKIAIDFGEALNIPTIALRYFNVYGPRQSLNNPYTGVMAIFQSRIKNNNPPMIFEDGKQVRDFIYVEDVAKANLLALEKAKGTNVYNVGTGEAISILEIANILTELINPSIKPEITQKFRAGDNRHDFADIIKIKRDLGFKPMWRLKKGLEKLVEWSKSQEAIDRFEAAEKERLKYFGR